MKISLLQRQEAEYNAILQQKYQEGFEKGAYEKQLEIVKNMLIQGLSVEVIVSVTNLPLEEITGIKS